MTVTYKTTHEKEARDRLLDQLRGGANILAYLDSLVSGVQTLEGVTRDVLVSVELDTATGDALDRLGGIVGEARQGLSDTLYRIRIRSRIAINRSSGTAPEILNLLYLLVDKGAYSVTFFDEGQAAFRLSIAEPLAEITAQELTDRLNQARSAGVRFMLEYSASAGPFFSMASGSTSETDATEGFANSAQTTGGKLRGVIEGEINDGN